MKDIINNPKKLCVYEEYVTNTIISHNYIVSDRLIGSFIPFGTFVGLLDDGNIGFLGDSNNKNQSDMFVGVTMLSLNASYYVVNPKYNGKNCYEILAGYKAGDLINIALGCKVGVRYGIDDDNDFDDNNSVYVGNYYELDNQNGLVRSNIKSARIDGCYINKLYSDYAIITLNNSPSKLKFT